MEKRKIYFAVISFLCGSAVMAQTFNPKVEVVNSYEGKLVDVTKKEIPMNVPDSLLKFTYTVDYSVFESPYKGSYNFQPYKIDMRPAPRSTSGNRLFLNMGAGYTCFPELDLVYSPVFGKSASKDTSGKKSFLSKMDVNFYDTFRGYVGNWGLMNYENSAFSSKSLDGPSGMLLDNRVGASVRYAFTNYLLEVDGAYSFFDADGPINTHMYHGGEGLVKLLPADRDVADYFYGGEVYVKAGSDDFSYETVFPFPASRHKLGISDVGAEFTLGKNIDTRSRGLCDVGVESSIYSGVMDGMGTRIWVTPRYALKWKSGNLDAGIKVSMLAGSDNSAMPDAEFHRFSRSSRYVYPDVQVRQFILPEHISVRASVTGGDELNCYSDLMRRNPFASPIYLVSFMDSSSDCMNATGGFDFDFFGKLHLGLGAGYDIQKNGLVDALALSVVGNEISEELTARFFPYFNFCDYNLFHSDLSLQFKSPQFELSGEFRYQFDNIQKNNMLAMSMPSFAGNVDLTCNWNQRVFVGVSAAGQSSRTGTTTVYTDDLSYWNYSVLSIPGFIDLGFNARYVIDRHWTIWFRAGNLLGQSVQRYFFMPDKERNFTLGFYFNL